MPRLRQTRIGGDQLRRVPAGFRQEFGILLQIGHPQRRQAVLAGAEKLAGTAEAKVDLRKLKAVAQRLERLEPLRRFLGLRCGEDAAEARMLAAADPPAKLVEFASPKRSPLSIVISVALGTSTPTSTSDVETNTCVSPQRKRSIAASFSSLVMRPWISPRR